MDNQESLKSRIDAAFAADTSAGIPCYYGTVHAVAIDTEYGKIGVAKLDWNGVFGHMGQSMTNKKPQTPENELEFLRALLLEEYRELTEDDRNSGGKEEYELFDGILQLQYVPVIIYHHVGMLPKKMYGLMENYQDEGYPELDITYMVAGVSHLELEAQAEGVSETYEPVLEQFLDSGEEDLLAATAMLSAGYEVHRQGLTVEGFENRIDDYALGLTIKRYFLDRIARKMGSHLEAYFGFGFMDSLEKVEPSKWSSKYFSKAGEIKVLYMGPKHDGLVLLKKMALDCFAIKWHSEDFVKNCGIEKQQQYLMEEFFMVYGLLELGLLPCLTDRENAYRPVYMKKVFQMLSENTVEFPRVHPEYRKPQHLPASVCQAYLSTSEQFKLFT